MSNQTLRYRYTVEPLLKDTLNKGHSTNNLPIKDTSQCTKTELSYSANTFITSEEKTTSLQWTEWLVPILMCLIFRVSTVYQTVFPH